MLKNFFDYTGFDTQQHNLLDDTFSSSFDLTAHIGTRTVSTPRCTASSFTPTYVGLEEYAAYMTQIHNQDIVNHHLQNLTKLSRLELRSDFVAGRHDLLITRKDARVPQTYVVSTDNPRILSAANQISDLIKLRLTQLGCTFAPRVTQAPSDSTDLAAGDVFCKPLLCCTDSGQTYAYEDERAVAYAHSMHDTMLEVGSLFWSIFGDSSSPQMVVTIDDSAYPLVDEFALPRSANQMFGGVIPRENTTDSDPSGCTYGIDGWMSLNLATDLEVSYKIWMPRIWDNVDAIAMGQIGGNRAGGYLMQIPGDGGSRQVDLSAGTSQENFGASLYVQTVNIAQLARFQSATNYNPLTSSQWVADRCVPDWWSALKVLHPVELGGADAFAVVAPYSWAELAIHGVTNVVLTVDSLSFDGDEVRLDMSVAALRDYMTDLRNRSTTSVARQQKIDSILSKSASMAAGGIKAVVTADPLTMPTDVVQDLALYDYATQAGENLYDYNLADGVTFKQAQNRVNGLTAETVWVTSFVDGQEELILTASSLAKSYFDLMQDPTQVGLSVTISGYVDDTSGDTSYRVTDGHQAPVTLTGLIDVFLLLSAGAVLAAGSESLVGKTAMTVDTMLTDLDINASYADDFAASVGPASTIMSMADFRPQTFLDSFGYPMVSRIDDTDKRDRGILVFKGVNAKSVEDFAVATMFYSENLA
jgi:hypothetical protein